MLCDLQSKNLNPAKQTSQNPSGLSPSQAFLQKISNKILNYDEFLELCLSDKVLSGFAWDDSMDCFAKIGLDLSWRQEKISLGSMARKWREQVYCFVDIETTDANPLKGNVLELGAILCRGDGETLGKFESCVKNAEIPPIIQEITGIKKEDVLDAPDVIEVLERFREFLGNHVFVAHNVGFDYGFLDFLYQKHFGVGLYNQSLCTIKMAQKLIQSPRFSLNFLNEFLQIRTPVSHRAYADAYTCKEIFLAISPLLPKGIGSTQSLLNFCR